MLYAQLCLPDSLLIPALFFQSLCSGLVVHYLLPCLQTVLGILDYPQRQIYLSLLKIFFVGWHPRVSMFCKFQSFLCIYNSTVFLPHAIISGGTHE